MKSAHPEPGVSGLLHIRLSVRGSSVLIRGTPRCRSQRSIVERVERGSEGKLGICREQSKVQYKLDGKNLEIRNPGID